MRLPSALRRRLSRAKKPAYFPVQREDPYARQESLQRALLGLGIFGIELAFIQFGQRHDTYSNA